MDDWSWLLRLVGFDAERIGANAELQLVWTNAPQSWGVFALLATVLAVAYGVIHLYRREIETCPRWCKRLLTALRAATLLLLLAIFLGPAIAPIQRQTAYPNIALLRDTSQSMNTADRYLGDKSARVVANATSSTIGAVRHERPNRSAVMTAALEQGDRRFLRNLEELGKLRVMDFDHEIRDLETRPARPRAAPHPLGAAPVSTPHVKPLPPHDATGSGTDLYRAIAQAIADDRTSAAVIWTDGQHTAKDHGPDQLLAIAKQAGDQGVRLLFVGVGDPNLPRNIQISEVYADPQVWRGDPFEIQAMLHAQGIAKQSVQVELTERRLLADGQLSGSEQILQRREVAVATDSENQRLIFSHTPPTEGRFAYSVRAVPLVDELSEKDNQPPSPAEVKVLGEQARVLMIAGSPTWEYRGLLRLLTREKSIDVSGWLQTMDVQRQQDGNTPIDRLPVAREALFAYDVIVLVDPNPIEFDAEWLALLKQFIGEHAGGFLYMAGPKYSGRFLAAKKTYALRDMLPVRFGDVRAMEVDALLSSNARAWELGIVAANVDQPIMRFDPEPNRSLDRWKSLPGIYWSFPAEQSKPASRALIEHTNPTLRGTVGSRPLLVTGQYGAGRSVYLGFNGTWRWRQVGTNSEYYKRFWIQMIRYLVEGRTLEGKRRGVVEADAFRYRLGDRIHLVARLKDSSYKPLERQQVSASVRVAGRRPEPLVLSGIANQPGTFQATLIARNTGSHFVQVELDDESANPPRIEATFAVTTPAVETNEVWLNKPVLTELGNASGGAYFEVDQLDRLLASIPDASRTIDVRGTPVPFWDTGRMLLLLTGLLCTEWAVRKHFKLM